MVRALLPFVVIFISNVLYAQEQIPRTNKIDTKAKVNKRKERPDGKRHYMSIIKTNTKGILYGNKCFEDFTQSMGFVYVVQVKKQSGGPNGFARFWHNFGVKTALVFTRGPWWKIKVIKQKEECRQSSGDFVG